MFLFKDFWLWHKLNVTSLYICNDFVSFWYKAVSIWCFLESPFLSVGSLKEHCCLKYTHRIAEMFTHLKLQTGADMHNMLHNHNIPDEWSRAAVTLWDHCRFSLWNINRHLPWSRLLILLLVYKEKEQGLQTQEHAVYLSAPLKHFVIRLY